MNNERVLKYILLSHKSTILLTFKVRTVSDSPPRFHTPNLRIWTILENQTLMFENYNLVSLIYGHQNYTIVFKGN